MIVRHSNLNNPVIHTESKLTVFGANRIGASARLADFLMTGRPSVQRLLIVNGRKRKRKTKTEVGRVTECYLEHQWFATLETATSY